MQAEEAAIEIAAVFPYARQQQSKGFPPFFGGKDPVVKSHCLRGLCTVRKGSGTAVKEGSADAYKHLVPERRRSRGFLRATDCRQHLCRFFRHIHDHAAVCQRERRVIAARFFANRDPIAKTYGNRAVRAPPGTNIGEIAEHRIGGQRNCPRVASQAPNGVGEIDQHAVPGGTVAPCKAPTARGDDSRERAVRPLRRHNVAEPFEVACGCVEQKGHLRRGHGGVTRPPVFFAVRTVGWKVVEVGAVGVDDQIKNAVDRFVRAGEMPDAAQVA